LNTLTSFKEFQQALGSRDIGVSCRQSTQEISGTGPKTFISRDRGWLDPSVIFKPESKQLCLELGSLLLHERLVGPD
jgi:hypothetical protein